MIKIRQSTKKDFEQYLRLRKRDILEYSRIINEKIKSVSNSQIKKEFTGMLKSKNHIVLIAEKNGKMIGYLNGSIIKNIWQNSGYVDDVFVAENFKRQGIGSHLIQSFIKFLKLRKIKKCKLTVNTKNKKAIKLYKKLGLKISHYEMDVTT